MYERTHDGVARVILQHVDSEKNLKLAGSRINVPRDFSVLDTPGTGIGLSRIHPYWPMHAYL